MTTTAYSHIEKSEHIFKLSCVQCKKWIRVDREHFHIKNQSIYCVNCEILFKIGDEIETKKEGNKLITKYVLAPLKIIRISGKFNYSIEPDERIFRYINLPNVLNSIIAQYCILNDEKIITDFIDTVNDINLIETKHNEHPEIYFSLLAKKERLMAENNIKLVSGERLEQYSYIDVSHLNMLMFEYKKI